MVVTMPVAVLVRGVVARLARRMVVVLMAMVVIVVAMPMVVVAVAVVVLVFLRGSRDRCPAWR